MKKSNTTLVDWEKRARRYEGLFVASLILIFFIIIKMYFG